LTLINFGHRLKASSDQEEAVARDLQLMTIAFVFVFLGAVIVGAF
jgi:hypothetical protein